MKLIITFNLFFSLLFSIEELDNLINEALNGSIESVRIQFPIVEKKYPYDPNMLFLKGLIESDGEKAKNIFLNIYKNYPVSKYSDDAVMKVAEYYYASGLYVQSAEWLKKMPIYYSRSEHIDRAIKLFLNSLIVSGHRDTAIHYSKVFKRQFPNIDIEKKIASLLNDDNKKYENNRKDVFINSEKKSQREIKEDNGIEKKIKFNKYTLQTGAFSLKANAEDQKIKLILAGYKARVIEINRKNRILFGVRVGLFTEKLEAEKISEEIKNKLAIKSIVITNE
tara:strand:+ start:422 stop:1261 length:840 start_codon:yes stop_codon:yes gene_type:complete